MFRQLPDVFRLSPGQGDVQNPPHLVIWMPQERWLARLLARGDENANAGAVDELKPGQLKHDSAFTVEDLTDCALEESRRCHVELAPRGSPTT